MFDTNKENPFLKSEIITQKSVWSITKYHILVTKSINFYTLHTPRELMAEKPKDIEKYFENSKCTICGVVVQPHFQGNRKLPKEEHLAKEHSDLE